MKLVKLSVERFQCIQKAEVVFGPHLNVLYGPNDVGKSSLAWAIRAVLLLQHSSSHANRFSSWYDEGEPRVALTFTDDSGRFWRVTKVFGGSAGRSTLESSKDGRSWTAEAQAREVDKRVRELLRWGLAAPGGQGRAAVPESFLTQVLLADQSQDSVRKVLFESQLGGDPDESGRLRLTEALGALAQDPVFKRVLDQTTEHVDRAYTPKGSRKRAAGSPWTEAADRYRELGKQKEELETKAKESAAVEEKLHQLHAKRDATFAMTKEREEALRVVTKSVTALRERDGLQAQATALETKLQRVQTRIHRIAELDLEVATLSANLDAGRAALHVAAEKATAATAVHESARRGLDTFLHDSPDRDRALATLRAGVALAEDGERVAAAGLGEATTALRAARDALAQLRKDDAAVVSAAKAVQVAEVAAGLVERDRTRVLAELEDAKQRQRDARSSDRAQARELRKKDLENRRLALGSQQKQLEDALRRAQAAGQLANAATAAHQTVQRTAHTLDADRADLAGMSATVAKVEAERASLAQLDAYGRYEQRRTDLELAMQRARDGERDRDIAVNLRARVVELRASHRDDLPDAQQLAALRALREELRIAEAALGGGLSLTIRPRRAVEVRAVRDGAAVPPVVTSEPLVLAAQRTLSLDIGDVLELEVVAGEDAARRKAADLGARWQKDGEATIVKLGVRSLEELEATRTHADGVAHEIAATLRDAEAAELRATGPVADVPTLRDQLAAVEAELATADRSDLESRFLRLTAPWQSSLRKRSADLDAELQDQRTRLEGQRRSIARLEAQLEAQQAELLRTQDELARAEQAPGALSAGGAISAEVELQATAVALMELDAQEARLSSGASDEEAAADAAVAQGESIAQAAGRKSEAAQQGLQSARMAHVQATTRLEQSRSTARQLEARSTISEPPASTDAFISVVSWEQNLKRAELALAQASAVLVASRAKLAEAQRAHEDLIRTMRGNVQVAEEAEHAARAKREALDSAHKDAIARHSAAVVELSNLRVEVASASVEALQRELAAVRERLRAVECDIGDGTEAELATLEGTLERLRSDLHDVDDDLARARGALEQVGGAIVRERVKEIEQALEQAAARENEIRVEFEAWRLLQATLRETESTESAHLGRALADPVSARFRELTDGRYGDLELGTHLEAGGIHVAGEVREIGALSAGTQDQLATLLRVCIAEQLESAIVLDDHLSQSDGGRVAWFNTMLREASQKVQIVLITCRPQEMLSVAEMPASGETERVTGVVNVNDLAALIHRYKSTARATSAVETGVTGAQDSSGRVG